MDVRFGSCYSCIGELSVSHLRVYLYMYTQSRIFILLFGTFYYIPLLFLFLLAWLFFSSCVRHSAVAHYSFFQLLYKISIVLYIYFSPPFAVPCPSFISSSRKRGKRQRFYFLQSTHRWDGAPAIITNNADTKTQKKTNRLDFFSLSLTLVRALSLTK